MVQEEKGICIWTEWELNTQQEQEKINRLFCHVFGSPGNSGHWAHSWIPRSRWANVVSRSLIILLRELMRTIHGLQTCSWHFCRCVGSWGQDKGEINSAWLWKTRSQIGRSVWGSLKELLEIFHIIYNSQEKIFWHWMLRMPEAGKRMIHWGWCLLNTKVYRAASSASTLQNSLRGTGRYQLQDG